MDPILEQSCKDFKTNEKALLDYEQGRQHFVLSGLFNVLRRVAMPKLMGIRGDPQSMATEAAFSNGYFQCIDDILYFKERFLLDKEEPGVAPNKMMQFGARDKLLKHNILTREELNGLK